MGDFCEESMHKIWVTMKITCVRSVGTVLLTHCILDIAKTNQCKTNYKIKIVNCRNYVNEIAIIWHLNKKENP